MAGSIAEDAGACAAGRAPACSDIAPAKATAAIGSVSESGDFTRKVYNSVRGTMHAVHTLRLHDPTRRPASWTEIIRAGQFAVFARHEASGVPCDVDGARFTDPA